jgi:hypothetical protein
MPRISIIRGAEESAVKNHFIRVLQRTDSEILGTQHSRKIRDAKMTDINVCLSAFARLSSDERQRSIRLIKAYNDAVSEAHTMNARETRSSELFSPDEIQHLVEDYRADRLSNIGPAMERYLSLLHRGYRWPNL